jgi:formate dehydrogenase (NADP+) beta subunit
METDCILCGGCVDICPVSCIEIVKLNALSFSENSRKLFKNLNQNLSTIPNEENILLIKNNEKCIRCGLCVKRCPVGTFIMEVEEEIEIQ